MNEDRARLRKLEVKSAAIRRKLQISPPNVVIYKADFNAIDDEIIVVEADGLGGATLKVAEGNYPIDFLCLLEKRFRTEAAAIKAAEQLKKRGCLNRLAAVRIFAPEFFVNDA
jgi:hypothetical protein